VAKTPTEARQASPRTGSFYVLIISTALAVLALGAFTLAFFSVTSPQMDGSQDNTTAQDQPSKGRPPEPKALPKTSPAGVGGGDDTGPSVRP